MGLNQSFTDEIEDNLRYLFGLLLMPIIIPLIIIGLSSLAAVGFIETKARFLLLPWFGVMRAPFLKGVHPWFGKSLRDWCATDIKLMRLKERFGQSYWKVNLIYVVSGIPPAALFLKWARLWGAKIVLNQDGVYGPWWYRGDCEKRNGELLDIHLLTDYTVYQSDFSLNQCIDHLAVPLREGRFTVLYNPCDLKRFYPRTGVEGLIDREGRPVVCEGGASYIELIVKDAERHRELAKSLPYKKTSLMAGHLPNKNMRKRYTLHTAMAFVNLKINDPCPNSVLEAMACGLPVVYHNSGGTPELVGDAGVPFENFEKDEIIGAIERVKKDFYNYSRKAQDRAKLFDIGKWYSRHEGIFKKCFSD